MLETFPKDRECGTDLVGFVVVESEYWDGSFELAEHRDMSGSARKSSTESIEPERRGKEKSGSFETRSVVAISGGHFTHDSYTAFLPSLLPLLIERLSLSLAMAGSLALFLQLPSLLNPLIGHLADRLQSRLFVVLAPGVTATFMVLLGMSESYFQLIFLLLCAGLSVASFHAPAPALVARVSGDRVGRGMSFFMTGGELGRTVGPVLAAWAASRWGLEGIYPLALRPTESPIRPMMRAASGRMMKLRAR